MECGIETKKCQGQNLPCLIKSCLQIKMDSMAKSSEETNKEIKEELGKNSGTKDEVFKVNCDLEEIESAVKSMMSSTEKRWDPKSMRHRTRKV